MWGILQALLVPSNMTQRSSFTFPGFQPEARRFLRELALNNKRDWFRARKPDFERFVRNPLLKLVEQLGDAIAGYAPGYERDPKRSVYRIYRDIRFSRNKDPYKTHASAVFPPVGLPRHGGAGFYFHFSADELLVGGGLYAPGGPALQRIRQQIAANPDELRAILQEKAFGRVFGGLEGQQLKRSPRGYPRDHPAVDLLVFKQFLAGAKLPAGLIEEPSIGELVDQHFRIIAPLLEYLNRPLRQA